MRGHQAFQRAAAVLFRRYAAAGQHRFQGFEKLLGNHEILSVAGMVESDQNLVRQAAAVTRTGGPRTIAGITGGQVFVRELAHRHPVVRPTGETMLTQLKYLGVLGI